MRVEYLAAIAFVAGTGLAVHSVGSLPPEKQSTPVASQLATLQAQIKPTPGRGKVRAKWHVA